MKFVVSSASLTAATTVAGRAVSRKNRLPILDYFLFNLDHNKLTIAGSDLSTIAQCTIDVESSDCGMAAIDTTQLINVLKTFSGEPLTFNIDNEFKRCDVSWSTGEFSMSCVNGADYPTYKDADEGKIITMQASEILAGIKNTAFCACNDLLMGGMCGILIDICDTNITFAATNRHQLAERVIERENGIEGQYLVPEKPADILSSLLPNDETEVVITFNGRNARFAFGNIVISCLLSEERFPNYKAIIPTNHPNTFTIGVNALSNAIKRCGVFSSIETGMIVFKCMKDRLSIHAENIDYSCSASENITYDYEGEENISVIFQIRYILEILAHIKTDTVRVKLLDNTRPGVLTPTDETADKVTFLLMTMVFKNYNYNYEQAY